MSHPAPWGAPPLPPQHPGVPPSTHRQLVALQKSDEHPGDGAGSAVHLWAGGDLWGAEGLRDPPQEGGGLPPTPPTPPEPTVCACRNCPAPSLYMMFRRRLW